MTVRVGRTTTLMGNELRMMWNNFRRTITTPSMLMFYAIMIGGTYFISSVLVFTRIGPLIFRESAMAIAEFLAPETILSGLGLLMIGSIVSGYFGLGPAAVLQASDEYVMMPAPVWPHQVFMSRYVRRLVRKFAFVLIVTWVVSPILVAVDISVIYALQFLFVVIVLFEINYLLSAVAFYMHRQGFHIRRRLIRYALHLIFPLMFLFVLFPEYNMTGLAVLAAPSSCIGIILMGMMGLIIVGDAIFGLALIIATWYIALYLFVALVSSNNYYEAYTSRQEQKTNENRIVRIIRGEVDFSTTRFNDPMIWIVLKDFWSSMRSSAQFWKYLSIAIGIIGGVILWIVRPQFFPIVSISPFILKVALIFMEILIVQMVSISSLISFVDEKDNVYLLKVSPFRNSDIVLAKYIRSVIESGFALIPMLLILSYLFNFVDTVPVLSFTIPVLFVFSAIGVMIGAYVPVFTNEPQHTPIPLIFAFPTVSLSIGVALMFMLFWLPPEQFVLLFPLTVVALVFLFLLLAIRALRSYK